MSEQMELFRKMLDDRGIKWRCVSRTGYLPITRTHFFHNDKEWSVVHGFGTYGSDKGLLELWDRQGEPIGWLTAAEAIEIVER